jgi:hypothetical protein
LKGDKKVMTRSELLEMGFLGFIKLRDIVNNYDIIPDYQGLYIVCLYDKIDISFCNPGTGGFFKGKDPNVSIEELNRKWIEGASVLYIGKAGGTAENGRIYKSTLRKRIKEFMRFGNGENIGHWGGRFIWQINEKDDLIIAYKVLHDENPVIIEKELINIFKSKYNGRLPFANLNN